MIENTFDFIFYVLILVIVYLIMANYTKKITEIEEKKLRMEDLKGKRAIKLKKLEKGIDVDDELEDTEYKLPDWLEGIVEGADLDKEKLMKGDPAELQKAKAMIDKAIQTVGGGGSGSGGDVIR